MIFVIENKRILFHCLCTWLLRIPFHTASYIQHPLYNKEYPFPNKCRHESLFISIYIQFIVEMVGQILNILSRILVETLSSL